MPQTGRSRLSVPRSSPPVPVPDGPRSSEAPPPDTIAVAHPSASPLPFVRPTARAWRTLRAPTDFGPLPAGHRPPVGKDPPACAPLPPRIGHVARPPPPPASPAPSQKGVGRCRRASAPFSLLRAHSEHPAANPIVVRPSCPRSAVSSLELWPQRRHCSPAQ
jgi:hypothetical protein